MDRGPVFVAGIERSGTSLMYALLASHPKIAMTRRTNLWRFFYNGYGDLSQTENFERCLAAIMRYKRLRHLQPDPERLRREFWQGEPTYARLFTLLQEHNAERLGKPRWGDKSLHTERYADLIFAAYPTARVIYMIRDPRDRYASSRSRWTKMRGLVGAGTAMWLDSLRWAQRDQRLYPDRCTIVRYETVVSQPEATLREVCAFLGEEYTPAMLTMEGAPSHRDQGGNSSYGRHEPGRITTVSIGRFRKVMSKGEIAFMQTYAGVDMVAQGYPPEQIRFSLGDRLLYVLADWPANLLRMIGWRALEAMRERMGRVPSPGTILPEAHTSWHKAGG